MNPEQKSEFPKLPEQHSVLLFAPFYNRSGYGMSARALAATWRRLGINFRIVPVDEVEAGIDDFDMAWLKSMESTPMTKPLAAVFFHVPGRVWLELNLPADCPRIMYTTFDSSSQGNLPPLAWVEVCRQMDQLWLQNAQEADLWRQAGIDPQRIHVICPTHPWVDNPCLPPINSEARKGDETVRFLCIGMYQPRRRWDTLVEAFLQEFADQPRAQLYLKVNYPAWHPVPGQPKRDLAELISSIKRRIPSEASVVLDEEMGTRLGICQLIDNSDFYISTDTCMTAPVLESLLRGKHVLMPEFGANFPEPSRILIPEDPANSMPMTPEMLAYQPHHQGRPMPLLHLDDVRTALRKAFGMPLAEARTPWPSWDNMLAVARVQANNPAYLEALSQAFSKYAVSAAGPLRLQWEGSQFLYHSLAHVNRQLCLGLLRSGQVDLSIVPYELDQFDGMEDPIFRPLAERVFAVLPGPADVHVRHQWPPRFDPPMDGAWVMIQPWEFGGIPAQWLPPMRELVDELWVPTNWVRDCYVKSGIPEDKVVVIPNGVDTEVFSPEGDRYPLQTSKRFRFLFLGGTIHRKGIDVLLNAYVRAFRASDEVCLVIKGQPGATYQGTELDITLAQIAEQPDAPEIEYLVEGLDEATLVSLYRACDVFVLPYRGEGFGLPIAEAMACGLPVMVTGRGASSDFVREEWAYLVKSESRSIPKVDAFEAPPCGFWLEEPSEDALVELLRAAYEDPETAREKGRRGRAYAEAELGWERAVQKVLERLQVLRGRVPQRQLRFGPSVVPEAPRCLFHFTPDLSSASWVRTLLAFAHAFKPGDPVALGFMVEFSAREQLTRDILHLMEQAGHQSFADVMVLDDPAEIQEWADEGGDVIDLSRPPSAQGHPLLDRLNRSLMLFQKG